VQGVKSAANIAMPATLAAPLSVAWAAHAKLLFSLRVEFVTEVLLGQHHDKKRNLVIAIIYQKPYPSDA
jgi:hypothetical protein